jgi:hypothetical protein
MEKTGRQELLKEYYACQNRIGQFDQQIVAVKSLGTTAAGALLATGFSMPENNGSIFLVAGSASLIFWYIEALWKSFQTILIQHSADLETMLHNGEVSKGPSINAAFENGFKFHKRMKRFFAVVFYANVILPYLPIAIFSFYFYFRDKFDLNAAVLIYEKFK